MAESCKICKHFLDSGHNVGTCRRYPIFQNRSPNEVCGEFFAKLVAIVPTEDVTPVPEAGAFLPKKRGRPAKAAK
jgi:hypothetical protein